MKVTKYSLTTPGFLGPMLIQTLRKQKKFQHYIYNTFFTVLYLQCVKPLEMTRCLITAALDSDHQNYCVV